MSCFKIHHQNRSCQRPTALCTMSRKKTIRLSSRSTTGLCIILSRDKLLAPCSNSSIPNQNQICKAHQIFRPPCPLTVQLGRFADKKQPKQQRQNTHLAVIIKSCMGTSQATLALYHQCVPGQRIVRTQLKAFHPNNISFKYLEPN